MNSASDTRPSTWCDLPPLVEQEAGNNWGGGAWLSILWTLLGTLWWNVGLGAFLLTASFEIILVLLEAGYPYKCTFILQNQCPYLVYKTKVTEALKKSALN